MTDHPYRRLPDWHFWKPSVAELPLDEVDPVIAGKFRIRRTDRIATAGSCFAQHIARHLQRAGFNYLITETANPVIPADIAEKYGYGLFTARYGNIYTSRQLLQLLQRSYDLFQPADDVWSRPDGRLIDPFRPRLQPGGFVSMAEYRADRRQHFAAVRQAIETLDVLVFTLGLTEGWISRIDGAAYPLCPGVAGGSFDEGAHAFLNLRADEIIADLRAAVRFVRERNPRARFILTVSPVPLVATAEPHSVLVSTVYSKSVLRVAAEEIARDDDGIAYFPSYEIITGPHTRGRYFAEDLRSVTEEGVARVMQLFFKHYADPEPVDLRAVRSAPTILADHERHKNSIAQAVAVMCDEVALNDSRANIKVGGDSALRVTHSPREGAGEATTKSVSAAEQRGMADDYEFATDWFTPYWENWLLFTSDRKISKILEIGSFEGRSTCAMIEHFGQKGPLQVTCVDNWQGSPEHRQFDMSTVEQRFNRNIARAIARVGNRVDVYKHKGKSVDVLSALMKEHQNSFDLVFVDGSHQACDVLTDLILSYHLCAIGGQIICDDYLWNNALHGSQDLLMMPRIAIDAFAHAFVRKVAQQTGLKLYQAYFWKTA